MMVGTASVLDPSLAPEGGHTLWVSSFAPYDRRDGRSWDDTKEAFAVRMLDRLGEYVPNLRDVLVASQLTSPLDWHRRTGSIRGNPNHLDMTLDQILGYRPLPELSGYRTHIDVRAGHSGATAPESHRFPHRPTVDRLTLALR